jgi:hypothetical protein
MLTEEQKETLTEYMDLATIYWKTGWSKEQVTKRGELSKKLKDWKLSVPKPGAANGWTYTFSKEAREFVNSITITK